MATSANIDHGSLKWHQNEFEFFDTTSSVHIHEGRAKSF